MKKSNFRNLCNNYSVCKNGKYAAILPIVIVLVAVIMIVALGTRPGSSYSDAVGVGIDRYKLRARAGVRRQSV